MLAKRCHHGFLDVHVASGLLKPHFFIKEVVSHHVSLLAVAMSAFNPLEKKSGVLVYLLSCAVVVVVAVVVAVAVALAVAVAVAGA